MARRVQYVVAAYVVIALVVVGWGWLLTHPLATPVDGFDDDVARWFAGQRTSWLDLVAEAGTMLGETVIGLAVGLVVALLAGLVMRSIWPAVLVLLADAGDGGFYWLGTQADPRDRPPVHILDEGLAPHASFPSGHVGTAVAVYGAAAVLLVIWLRTHPRATPARALVALLACVPVFVAASRLYEGAHHLTDVGSTLVYSCVWLAVLVSALRVRLWAGEPAVPPSARGHADAPLPHG